MEGAPTLEWIANKLNIDEDRIVHCFVFGSRLYGNYHSDSDWDIYVVVDGFVGPLKHQIECPDEGEVEKLVLEQQRNWDINVMEYNYWRSQLEDNIIYNAVTSLYIPPDSPCTLKKRVFEYNYLPHYMKLKRHVDHFQGKHREIAFKLFKNNKNVPKAKKILVHPLRCYLFTLQILQHGTITDFKAANEYYRFLNENKQLTFLEIENWYYETLYHLDFKFRAIINHYKSYSPLKTLPDPQTSHFTSESSTWVPPVETYDPAAFWIVPPQEGPRGYLKQFITKFGFQEFPKYFSIFPHRPYVNHPHLIQFECDTTCAPRASKLVEETQGIVLDSKNDWKIVCYPFERFSAHDDDEEYLPKIDWNIAQYTEKLSGISVSLFYYEGSWLVSFTKTKNPMYQYYFPQINESDERYQEVYLKMQLAFWNCFNQKNMQLPPPQYHTKTFMFVFVPENLKETGKLILVGVRDLSQQDHFPEENPTEVAKELNWEVVQFKNFIELVSSKKSNYPGESLPEQFKILLEQSEKLSLLQYEGYIVHSGDGKWNRITFKSTNYTNLEDMNNSVFISTKVRQFSAILGREYFEPNSHEIFEALYPRWAKWYHFVYLKLHSFVQDIDTIFSTVKHIQNLKEFSQKLSSYPKDKSSLLFQLKRSAASSSDVQLSYTDILREDFLQTKNIFLYYKQFIKFSEKHLIAPILEYSKSLSPSE